MKIQKTKTKYYRNFCNYYTSNSESVNQIQISKVKTGKKKNRLLAVSKFLFVVLYLAITLIDNDKKKQLFFLLLIFFYKSKNFNLHLANHCNTHNLEKLIKKTLEK